MSSEKPQERWPVGSVWVYGPNRTIPETVPIRRKVLGYHNNMIWHADESAQIGDYMYGETITQFANWCVRADAKRVDKRAAREGEGK